MAKEFDGIEMEGEEEEAEGEMEDAADAGELGEGGSAPAARADAKSDNAASAGGEGGDGERPPVSDFYKVVDYVTISKGGKWWSAAVETENFGRRQIALYLWIRDDKRGRWSRKQKFLINDWGAVKGAVEKLLAKKR